MSAIAAVEVAAPEWAFVFLGLGLLAAAATRRTLRDRATPARIGAGSVPRLAAVRFAAKRSVEGLCSWHEVDRNLARGWRRRWLHPLAVRRAARARRHAVASGRWVSGSW